MRNLMKFGMVLVVLAMVTGSAFASHSWIGPNPGSWCDPANWSNGVVPNYNDGETVKLDDDDFPIVDCSPAGCHELEMRDDSILQIGTSIANGDGADIRARFDIKKDLEMSDGGSSDDTTLHIVNGAMTVGDQSKDVAEDGDITITIDDDVAGTGKRNSLTFEDGMYFGDSNDGTNSVYILNIAGDFACEGDRLEHRGGHLIVNLTDEGTFTVEKTSRLSSDDDSQATINITDDASAGFDKIELGEKDDGVKSPFTYSLAINLSGDGDAIWDGSGEEIKDQDKGQILNIDVTGTGTFEAKDVNVNDDDSEINITMDSGTIDIGDDIAMNAGDIEITGGEFNVEDDFELGDDGVATMTASLDADVWIDDLYMADDSALTIDGVRFDVDSLKEMGDDSVVDILLGGELVDKDADDQDDWDDLNDLIADGQITTSEAGMVIVSDYDISHGGRFTMKPAIAVEVDIKPGTVVNPLRVNFRGSGVITVALVGDGDFDVSTVDVDTVTLAGVAALRGKMGDVSTSGGDLGPDGTPDLVLKFSRADVLDALEDANGTLGDLPNREELFLVLLGETEDGLPIAGEDSLVVLNRGAIKRRR